MTGACTYILKPTGEVACVSPSLTTADVTAIALIVLVFSGLLFMGYQLHRQQQAEELARAVGEGRFERSLELVRDVKLRLLHRNG